MGALSKQQSIEATQRPLRVLTGWKQAGIVAIIMLVGLALRLFHLDFAGYWHDEIISTFLARVPAVEIFRSITDSDTHPPLYHILLHFWGALFSYDLIPLRLFSVLTSLLCIPLSYWLGRAVDGPAVGIATAALMALAPFQIFHSQQARMYPLLTLVVLLMLLSFLGAWRQGGAARWALFGLVAAAGFYTHVYFAFSLLALDLWALAESARMAALGQADPGPACGGGALQPILAHDAPSDQQRGVRLLDFAGHDHGLDLCANDGR
ncbi:hypothetical protein EKD04_009835 [Chloroflexales bacterium ZM16-3]|nr:hypothetical protein [Chloroflexales bacterium ZM16-3]